MTVNYTVGAGENSSDLNVTLASLTAGTLQDSAGNDADLTLPSGNNLADNHAIVVDTDAPGVTSIMADTNPVYSGDLTTEVVVVFDETMNTGVTPTVAADTSANFSAGSGLWSTTSNTNDTYKTIPTRCGLGTKDNSKPKWPCPGLGRY